MKRRSPYSAPVIALEPLSQRRERENRRLARMRLVLTLTVVGEILAVLLIFAGAVWRALH